MTVGKSAISRSLCLLLMSLYPQQALAADTECQVKAVPHSSGLIRNTRQKVLNDRAYADSYLATERELTASEKDVQSALEETEAELGKFQAQWVDLKTRANKLENGELIVLNAQGQAMIARTQKLLAGDQASRYDWAGKPTWDDFQRVNREYTVQKKRYQKLKSDQCDLIAMRNRIVPLAMLQLETLR